MAVFYDKILFVQNQDQNDIVQQALQSVSNEDVINDNVNKSNPLIEYRGSVTDVEASQHSINSNAGNSL